MNLRPSRFVLALLLCLPMLCAAQTPASWKPDPKLLAQLGPEVSVSDYKIRPPQGYEAVPVKVTVGENNTINRYRFQGEQRPDNSRASFTLDIITLRPGNRPAPLTTVLSIYAKTEGADFSHFVTSSPEQGTVTNIPAARLYYKGISLKSNNILHGFGYVMIVGNKVLAAYARDRDPHNITSLPLLEAAALTFHKG